MALSKKDVSSLHKQIVCGTVPDLATYQKNMGLPSQVDVAMADNRHGDTSVHVAARHGSLNVLKHLHEEVGADLVHVNMDGKTPLHEAAQHGHVECARYSLVEGSSVDSLKKADWTPLMLACTRDNIKMVELLLDNNASVSIRNKDGWTAFHIAAREGIVSVISLLLDRSPDCWNTVSNNGRTPLHTVALHGRSEALKLLRARCRYDMNVCDSCGVTPLMDAIRGNHLHTTQLLLQYGADVHKCDILGREALHHGAQAGSLSAVEYIVNNIRSVDVNKASGVSMTTPLHYAAKEGHAHLIRFLLSHGANVHAVDKHGRKSIDIARKARTGSDAAVDELMSYPI